MKVLLNYCTIELKGRFFTKQFFSIPGPISSSFVNRWGCRAVTVAGGIIASACVMVSALANSVLTLIFTIGVGTGFGFGLIYLPAIVSVTVWFEKRRSLATGRYL